jgi:hypothetical protein
LSKLPADSRPVFSAASLGERASLLRGAYGPWLRAHGLFTILVAGALVVPGLLGDWTELCVVVVLVGLGLGVWFWSSPRSLARDHPVWFWVAVVPGVLLPLHLGLLHVLAALPSFTPAIGTPVVALVAAKSITNRAKDGAPSYHMKCRFETPDGRAHLAWIGVDDHLYGRTKEGDPLRIRYLPSTMDAAYDDGGGLAGHWLPFLRFFGGMCVAFAMVLRLRGTGADDESG